MALSLFYWLLEIDRSFFIPGVDATYIEIYS